MTEAMTSGLIIPILFGALLSLIPDQLLHPTPSHARKRPLAAHAIHFGIWCLLFSIQLLLFQRPWFVAINVAALLLIFMLISNAKFRTLREPFIYQDTEYLIDAFRHPRLYFPFLGLTRVAIICISIVALYTLGFSLESSIIVSYGLEYWLSSVVILSIIGACLIWFGNHVLDPPSLNPEQDLTHLGLLASLWSYAKQERKPFRIRSKLNTEISTLTFDHRKLPNIIAVQSESFFDPRDLYHGIRKNILENFDRVSKQALYHGDLTVPAWGANTVRSEFSFLTGLPSRSLGIHQFNPYRKLAKSGLPTLATVLRNMGYHTVCIHPYSSGFYNRERIYPHLGFDDFIDIRSFNNAERYGPFISDNALTDKILEIYNRSHERPIFLFAITMENHGPLHLEQLSENDTKKLYHTPPPAGCDDLTKYLRHLHNADQMIRKLTENIETLPNPAMLCWYGDHPPAMPDVYQLLGDPVGHSHYFIWANQIFDNKQKSLDVSDIANNILNMIKTWPSDR